MWKPRRTVPSASRSPGLVASADRVQHLAGFVEVDAQQLRIESVRVHLQQSLRLGGDRRRAHLGVRDRFHCRGERRGAAAVELAQRAVHLRDEIGVADQLRILAQRGELAAQPGASGGIGTARLQFSDELRQLRAQLVDRILDRFACVDRDGLRLPGAARDQRHDQALAVRPLLLDRLDVEPETRQRLGEQLEIVVVDLGGRVGVGLDLLLAQREQVLGLVEAQHAQRAAHLHAVARERGELAALRVVAEERVEHLLHVAQVGLDLATHLRDQHALLRAPAHLVERCHAAAGNAAARARGVEPRDQGLDLLREFRGQVRPVLERALGEQQAGRVLHRHRLGHAVGGQAVEPLHQRRGQLHQRALLHLRRLRVHRGERLLELGQVLGATRGELEPRVLGTGELFARLAQQRLQPHDVGLDGLGRGNQARKPEGLLHGRDLGADRRADGDVVQHLAPHPVRDLGAAFDDAADLQVDARSELLDAEAPLDTLLGERLEEAAHAPPERAQAAGGGQIGDAGHGVAHLARARLVATEPREQAVLVGATLLDQQRLLLRGWHGFAQRQPRRTRRQVGVEQVGGRCCAHAARVLHRLVLGEQAQRHRGRAVDQLVEEDPQLRARALDQVHRVGHCGRGQLLEAR